MSNLNLNKTSKFSVLDLPSTKQASAAKGASMKSQRPPENLDGLRKSTMSVEERLQTIMSVGEEVQTEAELRALLTARDHPIGARPPLPLCVFVCLFVYILLFHGHCVLRVCVSIMCSFALLLCFCLTRDSIPHKCQFCSLQSTCHSALALIRNPTNHPHTPFPPLSSNAVYDGFEPSGRMHIAQGVLRAINVNKLTSAGCMFKFWVADWFAQLNNKMGGDLAKIQTVGRYVLPSLSVSLCVSCYVHCEPLPFPPSHTD